MGSIRRRSFALFFVSLFTGYLLIAAITLSQLMGLSERWAEEHLNNQLITAKNAWEATGGCSNSQPVVDYDQLDSNLYSQNKFGLLIYCQDKLVTKTREAILPGKFTSEPQAVVHQDESVTFIKGKPISDGWIFASVAETYLDEVEGGVLSNTLLIAVTTFAFFITFNYVMLNFLLKPLAFFSKTLSGDVLVKGKKLNLKHYPEELKPLVAELNELTSKVVADKQSQAAQLDSEKRFTANAAHELLTPMAAIKTEVQLQRSIAKNDAQQVILGRIEERVDRATQAINQLLTLARLEPEQEPTAYTNFDSVPLIHQALRNNAHLADQNQLEIAFNCKEELIIHAIHESFGVMLDNLFANAFKYAIPNSKVKIEVETVEQSLIISTENDCKKLPTYLLEHIFDRFIRGVGEKSQGSGLGMSIIKRSVELHQGQVSIEPFNSESRLKVTISLPVLPQTLEGTI